MAPHFSVGRWHWRWLSRGTAGPRSAFGSPSPGEGSTSPMVVGFLAMLMIEATTADALAVIKSMFCMYVCRAGSFADGIQVVNRR